MSSGHAVLHWQAFDHHHHDDGGLHSDDSGGTAEHMQTESIGNAPCLMAANHPAPQTLPSLAPDVRDELGFTSHYLDGLLRPPKALA